MVKKKKEANNWFNQFIADLIIGTNFIHNQNCDSYSSSTLITPVHLVHPSIFESSNHYVVDANIETRLSMLRRPGVAPYSAIYNPAKKQAC